MNEPRRFETWHDPAIADFCKQAWASSVESEHRRRCAELCSNYLKINSTLLDAGAGTGLLYGELVPRFMDSSRYKGVDIAQPMLDIAIRDFPTADFIVADLYNLPFGNASFDVVACFEVLGHITDIAKPIAEMVRVAKSVVILTVWPAQDHIIENFENACDKLIPHRLYPDEYIAQLASEAGFSGRHQTIDWGANRVHVFSCMAEE